MGTYWRIRLLGGLEAVSVNERVGRFRTRRAGLLLARLAYHVGRGYPREELADLLWPEADKETGRSNLRQALSSLRKHLEPPGVPAGVILEADRTVVRLRPEAVECDAAEFLKMLDGGPGREPSAEHLTQAIDLYEGDLMPGSYEEWVLRERLHLEDLYISALKRRAQVAKASGDLENAVRDLRLALAKDPFRQEIQEELERVHGDLGQLLRAARPQIPKEAAAPGAHRPSDSGLARSPQRPRQQSVQASPAERLNDRPSIVHSSRPGAPTVRIPPQLTRFFGRQDEFRIATDALAERSTRLLSVVGPAGVGKSRLSVEVARSLAEAHGWNVAFVPLADLPDGRQLFNAILAALGIDGAEGDPLDLVSDRLDEGSTLLMLDNLEHLVESVAPAIERLLARIPSVAILATTRQALKVGGEQELMLGPLPLPATGAIDALDLETMLQAPSVALFVDRAKGPLADFCLSAHNAPAVGGICGKLEGLPLALEIAAGLTGVFSPAQILQSLDNQLALLRSRRRDLSVRHRSLRAAIESGYEPLGEAHRRLFVGLSVFRGGFDAASAASVCLPDRPPIEVLDLLLDLRERSFLQSVLVAEGTPRFRLLGAYREFAGERLGADARRDLRLRHARHYLALARDGGLGPEDRDNRAAALRTLYEEHAVPECVALMHSYGRLPRIDEDIVRGLAGHPDLEAFAPSDQVNVLGFLDALQHQRSEFEPALETCRRALALVGKYGLEAERVPCTHRYLRALRMLGHNEEVLELGRRNLHDASRSGDLDAVEKAFATLASAHWALGSLDEARTMFEGACEASRRRRGGSPDWITLYNLAFVQIDSGRLGEGRDLAEEVRREATAASDEVGALYADHLFCRLELIEGELGRALRSSHEILARRRRLGIPNLTLEAIAFHAEILATLGLCHDAAVLLGASRRSGLHSPREAAGRAAKARTGLTEEAFERAWSQGGRMTLDQAFRYALRFREVDAKAPGSVHDL